MVEIIKFGIKAGTRYLRYLGEENVMKEKVLVFIPYQDSDNFYSDGILTREYAILYLLWNAGYTKVINVKKPRTYLDKKRYKVNESFYPEGTIECKIKHILDKSITAQMLPFFNLKQLFAKRGWWVEEFDKYNTLFTLETDKEYLIYSDNPFAWKLIRQLHDVGCKVFFDVMDNFAIHPSLTEQERKVALDGYKNVFKYADIISANSQQTCDYMQQYVDQKIILVKNGVFPNNAAKSPLSIEEVKQIRDIKKGYKNSVGYIGKLGLRLNADLIESVSSQCPDTLFVFVGGYLKGQINKKLIDLLENRENIIHINAVPSAYVYPILDEFDILSIPHSVGKNENGGDPLKLYQYLTRNKPIITTPILGVDEFKKHITIDDDVTNWVSFIKSDSKMIKEIDSSAFSWETRISPIMKEIRR